MVLRKIMIIYQQKSKINRFEVAKEQLLIGILILVAAYFIYPNKNLGERTSLFVFVPLSFIFITALIIKAFKETIIIRIEISEHSGNLLITTNSLFKDDQILEFDSRSFTLKAKTYPSRLRPADKRIIISDHDNLLKISLRSYGIGKETFESIVNELKKNYPHRW